MNEIWANLDVSDVDSDEARVPICEDELYEMNREVTTHKSGARWGSRWRHEL